MMVNSREIQWNYFQSYSTVQKLTVLEQQPNKIGYKALTPIYDSQPELVYGRKWDSNDVSCHKEGSNNTTIMECPFQGF